MIDAVSLAVGAAILVFGILIGRILRPGRRAAVESLPICACDHSLGEHDEETGACLADVDRVHYQGGIWMGRVWVPCACRRYVGPEHISSVWAPPLLDLQDRYAALERSRLHRHRTRGTDLRSEQQPDPGLRQQKHVTGYATDVDKSTMFKLDDDNNDGYVWISRGSYTVLDTALLNSAV